MPDEAPVISTRLPRSGIRVREGALSGGRIPVRAITPVSLRRPGKLRGFTVSESMEESMEGRRPVRYAAHR